MRRLHEDIYDKVNTAIDLVKQLYYEDLMSKEYYNALISKLNEENPGDYYNFEDAIDDLIKYSKALIKANTAFGDVFYGICNEFV